MTEFETTAQLEISVSEASLSSARARIEEEFQDVSVDVDTSGADRPASRQLAVAQTDGGTPSGGESQSVPQILAEQLEVQEDMLQQLIDLSDDGTLASVAGDGDGGGGGGWPTIVPTGLPGGGGGALRSIARGSGGLLASMATMGAVDRGRQRFGPMFGSKGRTTEELRNMSPEERQQEREENREQLREALRLDEIPEFQAPMPDPTADTIAAMEELQDLSIDLPELEELQTFEFPEPAWVQNPPTLGIPSEDAVPNLQPPPASELVTELESAVRGTIPENIGVEVEEQLGIDFDMPDLQRRIEEGVRNTMTRQNLEDIVQEIVRREFLGR